MNTRRICVGLLRLGLITTLASCGGSPERQSERNQLQLLPESAATQPETRDFLTPFKSIWTEYGQRLNALEQELRSYLSAPSDKPKP